MVGVGMKKFKINLLGQVRLGLIIMLDNSLLSTPLFFWTQPSMWRGALKYSNSNSLKEMFNL